MRSVITTTIWLLLSDFAPAIFAQDALVSAPDPEKEEFLRQQLRKVERWKIKQLLATEKNIDIQQKKRAITSSNPDELALLAEDEDSGVRFHVAANPYAPLDILMLLARDKVAYVRSGVAMRLEYDPLASATIRGIQESMASALARDPSPLVKLALADNESIPASSFDVLAADSDFVIRQTVALNLHATQSALATLGQDSILVVQTTALEHRNAPASLLREKSEDASSVVRLAVSRNVNTPLDVLARLAKDQDPAVRKGAAEHERTPSEVLKELAGDAEISVVKAVANHPNTTRDVLIQLAYDGRDKDVRLAAHRRLEPILRSEIREDILERWTPQ